MSEKAENTKKIKAISEELEFDLFGVADVTVLREAFDLRPELGQRFDRAVSLGKELSHAVLEDIVDHPTPMYFHHYRQMNFFLDRGALRLADRIQKLGFLALPIAASQTLDWDKQKGYLSHKHVGLEAGLGWIGRNNLLVNPRLGSRYRLVTVLTDMPLVSTEALEEDCGSCRLCVAVCPAGAIRERPEDFDHLACYEKLKEFRARRLVNQFICGVCVRACRGRGRT